MQKLNINSGNNINNINQDNFKKFDGAKILQEAEQHCVFCSIINHESEQLIYEDENVVAFKDINQASAKYHMLVCPKKHIINVNYLEKKDIELLNQIEKIGQKVIQKLFPGEEYRFGFHKPPMVSVDHLHLHVFVLPIKNNFINLIQYGNLLHSVQSVREDIQQINK
ncbi:HIT-like domain [Pseudocohnilembus persalinus]|uniref:HIT-like domain n=1 Tax=Pseudocohnilembus persalinus TaxID=266149 RepID=A0A0V0QHQ5_PSEPJ|nr:HIT-like domain [Pseudocohnilembus persalinus]|eukprot:KRX01716.1 HIT-like domain [Pseudocohnilembus persalinus]